MNCWYEFLPPIGDVAFPNFYNPNKTPEERRRQNLRVMELLRRWMEEDANREPVEGILSAEEFEEELRKDPVRFRDAELDFLIDDQLSSNPDDDPNKPESPHEA